MVCDDLASRFAESLQPPVLTRNRAGSSRFVLLCDHASNRIPEPYGTLGLNTSERLMHVAWDPGALAVSKVLSDMLDAPLVHSTVSRLVIDPNRAPDARDLIPARSERIRVPDNERLDDAERERRIAEFHAPYHDEIDELLDMREHRGLDSIVVAIHTFSPVYRDKLRPWPVSLIHGRELAFTRALYDALDLEEPHMDVGWNEPYSAAQGVYFTVGQHADKRGLHGTMVEIRNTEILEPAGVTRWAHRLAQCLDQAVRTLGPAPSLVAAEGEEPIRFRRNA